MPELREVLTQAKAKGLDPARAGYDLCRAVLSGVREARSNRSDLVVKFGTYLLRQHASSLSHEVWATYEQVYVALLNRVRQNDGPEAKVEPDTHELRLAQEYSATMSANFPNSSRIKRLEGMLWEAKGDTDMARTEYEEILVLDPHNLQAFKRQIALCCARAKTAAAVKLLNEHLSTFCSDTEAWLLLHELYLTVQHYKKASFCIEELILINPMNYVYHLRAGEITYTQGIAERGSHDQLLTARKYFAHALELKPGCLRAIYGILLVCSAIGNSTKGKGSKVR